MHTHYLLDTNIIVFLLKKQFDVRDRIQKIGIDYCHISEITYAELLYGAECSSNPSKNIALTDKMLEGITMIPISDSLKQFAKCKAHLRKIGRMVDDADILIGSTAIANKMIMVTENTRHFEKLPGIKLDNWIKRD